jgi:hypothetical protein
MEQAQKLRWIGSMLDHLAGLGFEKDDATEWLSYFLGIKYNAAHTLASEALGLTQQCIIKKHLRFHFGQRRFFLEQQISQDCKNYYVLTFYVKYKHYKIGKQETRVMLLLVQRCIYSS